MTLLSLPILETGEGVNSGYFRSSSTFRSRSDLADHAPCDPSLEALSANNRLGDVLAHFEDIAIREPAIFD